MHSDRAEAAWRAVWSMSWFTNFMMQEFWDGVSIYIEVTERNVYLKYHTNYN